MGKSYTELRKEFEQEWAKNLKLYIKAGMSPEFIAAMREYDEAVFRKERVFQDNIPARIEYWDDPRLDAWTTPWNTFPSPRKTWTPSWRTSYQACPKGRPCGIRRSSCWQSPAIHSPKSP